MEPKEVVASLALHTVLEPIFTEMEREETMLASVQTLRDAFTKAERSHPGLAEEFLGGVLQAEGAGVDLPEALLQLACRDVDHYTIPSDEKEYVLLNERARALKVKLSHIPDQIQDRSQFLKIIRDIASAIKDVLDAVNEVSKKHQGDPRMREYKKMLDTHKKVFVKSSRNFSDTLKRYFKDGRYTLQNDGDFGQV
ncbi:Programmed cell death protein 10 [Geodia barretti]|uniref:Programmed cell death protein 10 n=1 Tax=Geodia barretti TaxID=519541 RepID=A0AA35R5R2_GEOBA|nr:Programmed cell death protein 10 [Geodia barretti]